MKKVTVFERAAKVERARLEPTSVRIELYRADAASKPPMHARAIVSFRVEGAGTVRRDLPIAEVLDAAQLGAGEAMALALVDAALEQTGFRPVELDVPAPAELEPEAEPGEKPAEEPSRGPRA